MLNFDVQFNSFSTPSHFNGFKIPSLEKFANMAIYFLDAAFLVTRLNKFLFYSDFYNYKQTGFSISGYNYAAIPRDPVPDKYKIIFNLLEEKGFILTEDYPIGDEYTEKFISAINFNSSLFSNNELESMETVKNKLSSFSTDKIIEMSHDELGWFENKNGKDLISYQKYASLLIHF